MKKINSTFFNEYKKLDRLLSDIYKDSHGVTCYIEDMKKQYPDSKELKTLKRLRYIRNKLAHDTDAFDEDCATEKDIVWIKEFYGKVSDGLDILAMQRKKRKSLSGGWKTVFITVIILVIISALIALAINSLIF